MTSHNLSILIDFIQTFLPFFQSFSKLLNLNKLNKIEEIIKKVNNNFSDL